MGISADRHGRQGVDGATQGSGWPGAGELCVFHPTEHGDDAETGMTVNRSELYTERERELLKRRRQEVNRADRQPGGIRAVCCLCWARNETGPRVEADQG